MITFVSFTKYCTSILDRFSVGVEVEGADGVQYGKWNDSEVYHADPITRIIAISISNAQVGCMYCMIFVTTLMVCTLASRLI